MAPALFLIAGVLCIVTALVHSLLGERRLIGPILASGIPLMANHQARQVTRFAWHWTSVLWMLVGAVLIHAGLGFASDRPLLALIGAAHLVMGLLDAVLTRGRHVGWPLITTIGVLTLLALFTTR